MKVLSRTLYVGIDDDPGEDPGRFFTSHINVKEARSVDNDDLGEGGNFTVYINVKLARSTIHRLHLQRNLHH